MCDAVIVTPEPFCYIVLSPLFESNLFYWITPSLVTNTALYILCEVHEYVFI